MIDYEITVDVSNVDTETKKRVQDAYFKLGFVWSNGSNGTKYNCLDKDCYTNTVRQGKAPRGLLMWAGESEGFLMWGGEPRKPTHTIDQLFELAGMKTRSFDLQKALRGEPVVLRNGLKAYVRHHETEIESAPLLGFFVRDGSLGIGAWEECGANYWSRRIRRNRESDYDIVGMWTDPPKFEYWHLLSEDIKFLAKDRDGEWFGYGSKPIKQEIAWHTQGLEGYYAVDSLKPSLFPDCDWENSLIERPENE